MKRYYPLFVFAMICTFMSIGYVESDAQTMNGTVNGTVVDETGEALAFANIVLFQLPDTVTVRYHGAADLQGQFAIGGVEWGSYLCHVSFIGYQTICDTLQMSAEQASLTRSYRMQPDAQMVGEVVVTGSKQTASVGKLSYSITAKERQGRRDAFEMMAALPNVRINPMERTITSTNGGSVMILINGLNSNATDLQAIRPDDVVRIEHYEVPPSRYAAYESVINVVLKPKTTGWTLAGHVESAVTTLFSNDWLNFSFFKGRHQLTVDYALYYRNIKNRTSTDYYEYDLNRSHYIKNERDKDKFGYDTHYVNVAYTYRTDKTAFRAKFMPTYSGTHSDGSGNIDIREDAMREERTKSLWRRGKEFNPVVDLYAQHSFTDKDELALNIVGTGFFTDNKYTNKEYEAVSEEIRLNEDVKENNRKFSLIGEVWYSHKWNKRYTLSAGYQLETYRLNSEVDNTFGYNKFNTDFLQNYVYAELTGNHGRVGYTLSLGATQKRTSSVLNRYSTVLFRPSLTAQYNMSAKHQLRLQFVRQSLEPSIAALSNNKTYVIDGIISMGNPYLRNATKNRATLTYAIQLPWLSGNISPYYSYVQSPLNSYFSYSEAGDEIVRQTENGLHSHTYGFNYSCRISPFRNNLISATLNGSVNQENVKSKTIGAVKYLDAPLYYQIDLAYKQWSATYAGVIVSKSLRGDYLSTVENLSYAGITYQGKNWAATAHWYWPFDRAKYRSYTIDQSIVKNDARTRVNDSASMVVVGFTLYLNKGKTHNNINEVIKNKDTQSGSYY